MQEDYSDTVCHCTGKNCVSTTQLELKLEVTKRGAVYFKNQKRTRDDAGLLLGESLQNMVCGNIRCSANLELVRDLLLQLEECKSMGLNGIHPRLLQELSDVLVRLEISFS